MNLRQLEAFHQVVVTGSVSEAAREMCRSQPAVTSLIKGLEESVGFPLFERRGRRLLPLPEAQYLLEESRDILGRVNRVHRTMEAFRDSKKGTLRLAGALAPSLSLLPGLINEVIVESDGVQVSLTTSSSMDVHHLVSSQQVDIGLADMGAPNLPVDETLVHYRRISMDGVMAMASDDPLAGLDVVTPNDLSERALVTLQDTHVVSQSLATAFDAAGAVLNARLQAQASYTTLVPIREGAVIGLLDPMTARGYVEWCGDAVGIAFRPFEPAISYEFAILTPAHLPHSILSCAFTEKLMRRIGEYKDFFARSPK